MTGNGLLQIVLTLGVMIALVKPLGAFMAISIIWPCEEPRIARPSGVCRRRQRTRTSRT